MNCKKCNWLMVNKYRYADGSQTIECIKHNKFLEFTDKNGNMPGVDKFKKIIECAGDNEVILSTNPKLNSGEIKNGIPQSGVKCITWDKKWGVWRVTIWLPTFKKSVIAGNSEDLEEAKKILKKAIKNIDKYELEEKAKRKLNIKEGKL